MSNLRSIEVKAFVPARDFELSKQFYQDLGFEIAWSSEDVAYLRHGNSAFLLQNFYDKPPDNFMMHLLVEDVEAWWQHVQTSGLIAKYGVRAEPPSDKPWGLRDFVIVDPELRSVARWAEHRFKAVEKLGSCRFPYRQKGVRARAPASYCGGQKGRSTDLCRPGRRLLKTPRARRRDPPWDARA